MLLKKYVVSLALSTSLITPAILAEDATAIISTALEKVTVAVNNCDPVAFNKLDHKDYVDFNGWKLKFQRETAEEKLKGDKKWTDWCAKGGKSVFTYDVLNAEFIDDDKLMSTIKYQWNNTEPDGEVKVFNAYSTDLMVKTSGGWLFRYGHMTPVRDEKKVE